mmetsp:Transcript_25191/g.30754  ORF Transcript_25191/g.30754 Transcript_25191/m.30754 type:complete len:520 (+) Transcript_25191:330-1889(+)
MVSFKENLGKELRRVSCPSVYVPVGHTFYSWYGGNGLKTYVDLPKLPKPERICTSIVSKLQSLHVAYKDTELVDFKWAPCGHTGFSWMQARKTLTRLDKAIAANKLAIKMKTKNRETYRCINMYKTSLKFHEGYAFAWFNLSSILFTLAENLKSIGNVVFEQILEASLLCMERAVLSKPDFVAAQVSLSAAYLRQRKLQDAILVCENALAVDCMKSEIHYNYAVSLRLMHRRRTSISVTQKYLQAISHTDLSMRPIVIRNVVPVLQDYKGEVHVVCIKWGKKYGSEYVNKLGSSIRRNLKTRNFRLHCFTDDPDGIDEDTLIHSFDKYEKYIDDSIAWKGWWYKLLVLFHRELKHSLLVCSRIPCDVPSSSGEINAKAVRVVYIDLDTVITGPLDDIFSYAGEFGLLSTDNFENEAAVKGGYNSSMMIFDAGFGVEILDTVKKIGIGNVNSFVHRMDHWLEIMVENADFLQNIFPGQILEYRRDVTNNEVPPNGRIVNFPLHPKPNHLINKQWIKQNWR